MAEIFLLGGERRRRSGRWRVQPFFVVVEEREDGEWWESKKAGHRMDDGHGSHQQTQGEAPCMETRTAHLEEKREEG